MESVDSSQIIGLLGSPAQSEIRPTDINVTLQIRAALLKTNMRHGDCETVNVPANSRTVDALIVLMLTLSFHGKVRIRNFYLVNGFPSSAEVEAEKKRDEEAALYCS